MSYAGRKFLRKFTTDLVVMRALEKHTHSHPTLAHGTHTVNKMIYTYYYRDTILYYYYYYRTE